MPNGSCMYVVQNIYFVYMYMCTMYKISHINYRRVDDMALHANCSWFLVVDCSCCCNVAVAIDVDVDVVALLRRSLDRFSPSGKYEVAVIPIREELTLLVK